ncbi:hypothetical protein B296_00047833, partial [Ensete ventricosum]
PSTPTTTLSVSPSSHSSPGASSIHPYYHPYHHQWNGSSPIHHSRESNARLSSSWRTLPTHHHGPSESDDDKGRVSMGFYVTWFVLAFVLLFTLFSLILWGASLSHKPQVIVKVPAPEPIPMEEFYLSRESRRVVVVAVADVQVPLYGGGSSLRSRADDGGAPAVVPLELSFTIRARAHVLDRLVKVQVLPPRPVLPNPPRGPASRRRNHAVPDLDLSHLLLMNFGLLRLRWPPSAYAPTPARSSPRTVLCSVLAFPIAAVIVLLHITFVGVIFLFDANLIRKSREEPWLQQRWVLPRLSIGMGCTELYRAMLTHGTWGILMYRPYRFPVGPVLS